MTAPGCVRRFFSVCYRYPKGWGGGEVDKKGVGRRGKGGLKPVLHDSGGQDFLTVRSVIWSHAHSGLITDEGEGGGESSLWYLLQPHSELYRDVKGGGG